MNKLPTALAIELLRLFGVTRSLGTKARGSISVLLSQALTDSFIIPAGYQIPFRDGIYYKFLETLSIPPGSYEGTVEVECSHVGTIGNVAALGLVQTSTGLNYVNMIYNKEDISGGTEVEPLEATVIRGQQSIRQRDTLVTLADYEAACQALLGYGSKAVAVSAMDAAKLPDKLGNVHVFLVDAQGKIPSISTCQAIKSQLVDLIFAGSELWVSPVSLQDIYLEAVITVPQVSDLVAQECLRVLGNYLKPSNYELGSLLRVKELEYLHRTIQGVAGVEYVTINGSGVNHPMPQSYYAPNLVQYSLMQITPDGTSKTYDLLQLEDPD
jgi:hypothetical protein